MLLRLEIIGPILPSLVEAFAYSAEWLMSSALTPVRFIDTLEQVNGIHPGLCRNHAKRVCIGGFFESAGRGVPLSKGLELNPGRVSVIGSFASASGQPYATDAPNTVRSIAILSHLPDAAQWRTGANEVPIFAVNIPEGFSGQLLASRPNPATGKPDEAMTEVFLGRHPETVRATSVVNSRRVSSGFDNSTYSNLDAFRFVNAAGMYIRGWSVVTEQPFEAGGTTKTQKRDRNYLFDGPAPAARVV